MGVETMTLHERAEQLAGVHNSCDDEWYACPLSSEGCLDDSQPKDQCNCGRNARAAAIESAFRDVVVVVPHGDDRAAACAIWAGVTAIEGLPVRLPDGRNDVLHRYAVEKSKCR